MPKISTELVKELNKQINSEFYSAYLYLSMASYLESRGLKGFASWMRAQAKEELEHAMKLFDYVLERGGEVVLDSIQKPPSEWETVTEMVRHALRHEEAVTESINKLFQLAREKRDPATEVILQWFVSEQVEEEALFSDLLFKVEAAGEDPRSLIMLDQALAKRKE